MKLEDCVRELVKLLRETEQQSFNNHFTKRAVLTGMRLCIIRLKSLQERNT